jgi:hypothetical protein
VAFEIRVPGRPVTGAFDPVTQRLWECLANGCGLSPAAAGTIFSTGRNPPERPAECPAAEVQTRDLASYAGGDVPTRENAGIVEEWGKLKADLCAIPEFAVLSRAGVLDSFRDGFSLDSAPATPGGE